MVQNAASVISRALAKLGGVPKQQEKTAAKRWLEDHQLTKLCRLCRAAKKTEGKR